MSLYGGLLRLYPRGFREEYGPDMEQLLREQLRDESAARVWGRAVLDLALTVPSQRLEATMSRSPSAPVLYSSAAVACLVLTALSGTALGVGTAGLLGVVVFASLAVLSWRRSRTLGGGPAGARWWKYLATGVAGVGTCVVIANLTGDELPEGTWFFWMAALLTSLVLLAVGLVLGITHAVGSRRPA